MTDTDTHAFLGEEFLTWLWFRLETKGGDFDLSGGRAVGVAFDDYLKLAPADDDATRIVRPRDWFQVRTGTRQSALHWVWPYNGGGLGSTSPHSLARWGWAGPRLGTDLQPDHARASNFPPFRSPGGGAGCPAGDATGPGLWRRFALGDLVFGLSDHGHQREVGPGVEDQPAHRHQLQP